MPGRTRPSDRGDGEGKELKTSWHTIVVSLVLAHGWFRVRGVCGRGRGGRGVVVWECRESILEGRGLLAPAQALPVDLSSPIAPIPSSLLFQHPPGPHHPHHPHHPHLARPLTPDSRDLPTDRSTFKFAPAPSTSHYQPSETLPSFDLFSSQSCLSGIVSLHTSRPKRRIHTYFPHML